MYHPLFLNGTLFLWVSLMASSFIASAYIVPYASPIVSTGLRFWIAGIVLLPFVAPRLRPYMTRKIIIRYSFISATLVIFFVGMFESLKYTSAFNTSVIYTGIPIICVILATWLLNERSNAYKMTGYALGSVGAVWVLFVSQGQDVFAFRFNQGDLIFFVASIFLAAHIVLIRKWGSYVPPQIGAFLILLCGSIMMLPIMLMFGSLQNVQWQSLAFWKILLFLSIFTTLFTFSLQQFLVRTVGPNRFIAFSYLIPLFVAIAQGALTGGLLWYIAPGILLTGLSLIIVSREQDMNAKPQT